MKHAVIIFTKVPQVGVSKTRLTETRGGILSDQEANDFYEGFLADAIHACTSANADIYLCHDNAGDRKYLDKYLKRINAPAMTIYHDKGGSFDECMQYAADYILKNGATDRLADSMTIIGGDLPTLQPHIVQDALDKLDKLSITKAGVAAALSIQTAKGIGAAMVEGACQEGGFSLIGYTCTTPFDFSGVFYNEDGITALDMVVQKGTEKNIPLGIVEQVPDVDIPVDLASMISNVMALELAGNTDSTISVPKHTIAMIRKSGLVSMAFPPDRIDEVDEKQT